jgi:hypothetical protein
VAESRHQASGAGAFYRFACAIARCWHAFGGLFSRHHWRPQHHFAGFKRLELKPPLVGVPPIGKRELAALLVAVSAAAVLLYPTALGWGDWDAYRLGWGSWWFLSVLLALSVASVWIGLRVLPALIALALLVWTAGLMESGNLWDHLMDPWLSSFALAFVFIKCLQIVFKRFYNRSNSRSSD